MSKSDVNKHLKKFAPDQRKILTDLRDHIASKLPTAEQVIKYGIPTFLIEGVPVIGFDGYKTTTVYFRTAAHFNIRLKKELENYEQTKGSIHFEGGMSIPKPLLNKILTEKIIQINSLYPKKSGEFLEFYTNGVLKAKGKYKGNKLNGEWKWFRKTGIIMRSGSFRSGEQVGTWITYDAKGKVYKEPFFPAYRAAPPLNVALMLHSIYAIPMSRNPEEPVYNRIEEARAALALSRQELADKVGVHYQTIGYLEREEYSPSLVLAIRIAKSLNQEVSELFSLTPFKKGK